MVDGIPYEEIVKDFQYYIDELILKNNHTKLNFQKRWKCQWGGYLQTCKILNLLYKDANIYLKRKYDKFMEIPC